MSTNRLAAPHAPGRASAAASRVVPAPTIWWTAERGLYAAAFLIGLVMRVWQLGSAPLSAWEASNVWPAWLAAQGLSVANAPLPNSPLMYNLHWLTFLVGADGDIAARWVGVVAGSILILTPWWLRGGLGRQPALVAAFLFAVDPWLISISRLADGASLALLIGVGALVGLIELARTDKESGGGASPVVIAVLVGLLPVSGPMGWNLLPVLALAAWLWRRELANAGVWSRHTLPVMVAAAVAGGSLFLTRFDALAWTASSLSVWWAQFDGQPAGPLLPMVTGGYSLGWPWLRLLVDAPMAGLVGAAGLALLWLETPRRYAWLLTGWVAWGVLLWLMPGRSPLALPVAGLALNLAAAVAVSRLVAAHPAEVVWREVGAVGLTLAVLSVSAAFWATRLGSTPIFDAGMGQIALVNAALIIAILVAYGVWAGRRAAVWTAAVVVMCGLALLTARASNALLLEQQLAAPSGWQALQTDPEIRRLADEMETLSAHTHGDPTEQPVQIQIAPMAGLVDEPLVARPDPILGWYLRDMRRLTWVTSPKIDAEEPRPLVVMLNDDAFTEDEQDAYVGSKFDVEVYWQPDLLVDASAPVVDAAGIGRIWPTLRLWWRWWMYHKLPEQPATRTVTLWAPIETGTEQ